jgi:acyl-CoA thioesterase I
MHFRGKFSSVLACAALFASAELGWSADSKASAEAGNIVVLGDSLAAGYGLDPAQAFPALLQQRIKEAGWNFKVINAGVSGDTSAGGLRRLDWLLKRKVDVLVIELGGNDGLRGLSPRAMKKNLQAIIDRTREKYPAARIVIAGMKMPANFGEYAVEFARVFPELATENKLPLVPFLLEGVGGDPKLNLPDRIHPTAEGQKILADNVWLVLKPILTPNSVAAK